MKKHLSVLMLAARSSVFKVLALLLLAAGLEGLALWLTLARSSSWSCPVSLEGLIESSHIGWIMAAALVLLTAILCLTGCEFGSKQGYTLRRLRVSERSVFFWQSAYNAVCLLGFWAVQTGVALAFSAWYAANAPAGEVTGQTVFLAFYRSGLLHSLLPLSDWLRWLGNLLALLGLALASAQFPVRQRRGGWGKGVVFMLVFTIALFDRDMGSTGSDGVLIGLSFLVIVSAVLGVLHLDEDEREEEQHEKA